MKRHSSLIYGGTCELPVKEGRKPPHMAVLGNKKTQNLPDEMVAEIISPPDRFQFFPCEHQGSTPSVGD